MGKRGADGGRSQDSFEGASATASPDSGVWTKLRKDVPLNSPPPKAHSDVGLIFFFLVQTPLWEISTLFIVKYWFLHKI